MLTAFACLFLCICLCICICARFSCVNHHIPLCDHGKEAFQTSSTEAYAQIKHRHTCSNKLPVYTHSLCFEAHIHLGERPGRPFCCHSSGILHHRAIFTDYKLFNIFSLRNSFEIRDVHWTQFYIVIEFRLTFYICIISIHNH